jgi:hypothetical protein
MMNKLYDIAEQIVFNACGGGSYRQAAKEPMLSKVKAKLREAMPKGARIQITPRSIMISSIGGEKIII